LIGLKHRLRRERNRKRRHRFGGWYSRRYRELGYSEEDFQRRGRGGVRSALWGGCVEVLRDYMWTGDREQLERCWPIVKSRLEAGIAADQNGDGLPDGAISFTTYDHWFLPATNCYKCSMWLGELQAGARLAELVGDDAAAGRCREVLQRGAESFEEMLWNGQYYDLCYDPNLDANDSGCIADQVSGHLFARLCGLGPIHDEERVRGALRSVRRLNLVSEEGLLNGVDPQGREDWRYFCRYSATGEDEARGGQWPTPWTGTEYYVAAVMAAEGLAEESLDVVRAVWDRYAAAGMAYNHIECGEHYFRPLAAWAVLPALQGLVWNAPEGRLTFRPHWRPEEHDTLFILPAAWGRLRQRREETSQTNEIAVERGELPLAAVDLEVPGEPSDVQVTLAGEELPADWRWQEGTLTICLPEPRRLQAGQALTAVARVA
ncbi:MAG: GH116 family glycosyl hydrolase, partial [Candidatus Brocadiia bacterium]